MRSIIGNSVVGDDFRGREMEIGALSVRVRDGNHVLLYGQRRTGKTSIAHELGRRLEGEGWTALYADVEKASSPEDAISELARGIHSVLPIASRIVDGMDRRLRRSVSELSAGDFCIKFRAELDSKNWHAIGHDLMAACAKHKRPVLFVIDELPVFLSRLSRNREGKRQVDQFLSWMRHAFQTIQHNCPVAFLTGSTGLLPLVERLGMTDRINYLAPFPLEPWNRDASIQCFCKLAEEYGLIAEEDVAGAVHDALGLGVPHYVQRMFVEIRDFSGKAAGDSVTKQDVAYAYSTGLLGPRGQGDLIHYEFRLRAALDADSFAIAMEILAEAATQGAFSAGARQNLEDLHLEKIPDASERVRQALGVLEHDGYLIQYSDGYRFAFKLLRDWMKKRFDGIHRPLNSQLDR